MLDHGVMAQHLLQVVLRFAACHHEILADDFKEADLGVVLQNVTIVRHAQPHAHTQIRATEAGRCHAGHYPINGPAAKSPLNPASCVLQ